MGLFSSGNEPSERAKELARNAGSESVTPEVLGKVKASGIGSHDYLADGPLVDHLDDSEQPEFVFTGAGPAAKVERRNDADITSTGKYRVILTITDERVLVVVGDGTDGDWSFEVRYDEITGVETGDGSSPSWTAFTIRTSDEAYTFNYVGVSSDETERAREYVGKQADLSEPDAGRDSEDGRDGASASGSGTPTPHLDADPQGDWVTAERITKMGDLLEEDEAVHYMWRGGTIDVEGSGAGESLFGNDRDRKSSVKGIFTAITDKRVVINIPQFLGDDERHIPYHSITSVDLDTGLMARRVSLQTKGQTYHVQAQGPSKDELRAAIRFVREKVEETHRPQQVQATSEPDPTEQLKNLTDLHEQGVLTDEEFEEKKRSLLDQI